jgi:hypothetical protein
MEFLYRDCISSLELVSTRDFLNGLLSFSVITSPAIFPPYTLGCKNGFTIVSEYGTGKTYFWAFAVAAQ